MFKFLSVDTNNYKRQFRFSKLGTYIITDKVYQLGAIGRFLSARQVNNIYFPITTREAGWGAEAGNGD